MLRRPPVWLIAALLAAPAGARADRAAEIVRIHLATLGGRERLDALHAYRATGRTLVDHRPVAQLTVIAARPNRLRVELRYPDHTVVLATDGVHPPWRRDTADHNGASVTLSGAAAEDFAGEAEFEDPLAGAAEYGNAIDFAGETTVNGEPRLRLLVTQRLTKTFYLLVDPMTYFIVSRIDVLPRANGSKQPRVTRYADFRPVAGVLWPHRTTVLEIGEPPREAVFDRIEADPVIPAAAFSRPE